MGVAIASVLDRLYGEKFQLEKMKTLLGDQATLQRIRDGLSVSEITDSWKPGLAEFENRRRPYLLYRR